jgi:threonine dehydrogenase-like Zn-dependent dehydrogenase
LLEAAPVAPDESAVVTGAAGALGSIAVQLAVCRGAGRVIALASTPRKREFVADLGAHAVTDSSAENFGTERGSTPSRSTPGEQRRHQRSCATAAAVNRKLPVVKLRRLATEAGAAVV